MSYKNIIFPILTALIFTFALNSSIEAQNWPVEDQEEVFIDTIDQSENLLDSNEAYKKQFDSLSKDGEWVKTTKSEFLQELNENTDEFSDLGDIGEPDKVIYVWRPYVVDNYWNPYTNGYWVFTNFGWVWSSYYSWGWGPYNYGRWYCSSYYGWVWFPGSVWAPNWVSWRSCGNYVGWYPTCPVVRWRGRGTHVYTNHLFAYTPSNWVFVNQKDFTKKIDKTRIVKSENNAGLLKKSEKIKVTTYNDPKMAKFKYEGPDAILLARESGVRITPEMITAGSSDRDLKVKDVTTKTGSDKKEDYNTRINNGSDKNTSKEKKDTRKYNVPDVNTGKNYDEKPKNNSGTKTEKVNKESSNKSYNEKPKSNNESSTKTKVKNKSSKKNSSKSKNSNSNRKSSNK